MMAREYLSNATARLAYCSECGQAQYHATNECSGYDTGDVAGVGADACEAPLCNAALAAVATSCAHPADEDGPTDTALAAAAAAKIAACTHPFSAHPFACGATDASGVIANCTSTTLDAVRALRSNWLWLIKTAIQWPATDPGYQVPSDVTGIKLCAPAPVTFMGQTFPDKDSCEDWCQSANCTMGGQPCLFALGTNGTGCSDECDECPDDCASCDPQTLSAELCPLKTDYLPRRQVYSWCDCSSLSTGCTPTYDDEDAECPQSAGGARASTRGAVFNSAMQLIDDTAPLSYGWETGALFTTPKAADCVGLPVNSTPPLFGGSEGCTNIQNRLMASPGWFRANNSGSVTFDRSWTERLVVEPYNTGDMISNGSDELYVLVIDPFNAPVSHAARNSLRCVAHSLHHTFAASSAALAGGRQEPRLPQRLGGRRGRRQLRPVARLEPLLSHLLRSSSPLLLLCSPPPLLSSSLSLLPFAPLHV
jgi:hypothetical protein